MARQRFIHPTLWKDPVIGRLLPLEQVLFIGLFSIADDFGRTIADPAYLRSELFAYKDYTAKKVKSIRDSVVEKVASVHLYQATGVEYIALLKWHEYQKPKYPTASKLPAPFLEDAPILPQPSGKPGGSLPENLPTGRVGMGEGLGLGTSKGRPVVRPPASQELPDSEMLERLLRIVGDSADEGTRGVLTSMARKLPPASLAKVIETTAKQPVWKRARYANGALQSEIDERSAA